MSAPGAVVIGGGPAGSAAAFWLARAGVPVTIIESRAFPRAKVCGEFISPAATDLLEAIVPAGELARAGARRVDRFVLELGGRSRTLRMGSPAWALSRFTLDGLLLDRAVEAGAVVRQPAAVQGVDHGSDGTPARVTLATGEVIEAGLVLHADGHGRFCPGDPTPSAPGLVGHKCHFTPPRRIDGVTIRAAAGAYVGTIQIEPHDPQKGPTAGSNATVALVARRELLKATGGDIDAMVRRLWPAWDPARRVGPWLSCGVARSGYRSPGATRALRLGNAAAAVDPVGGEGIGLALWSGSLAGRLAGEVWRSGWTTGDLVTLERHYASAYRRRLALRRPACRLASAVLMRPALVGAIWPLLAWERATIGAWYAATGKPVLGRH